MLGILFRLKNIACHSDTLSFWTQPRRPYEHICAKSVDRPLPMPDLMFNLRGHANANSSPGCVLSRYYGKCPLILLLLLWLLIIIIININAYLMLPLFQWLHQELYIHHLICFIQQPSEVVPLPPLYRWGKWVREKRPSVLMWMVKPGFAGNQSTAGKLSGLSCPSLQPEQTQVGVIIKIESTGARKGSHFNRRRVGTKAGEQQGGLRNPDWTIRWCERKRRQHDSSSLRLVPCGLNWLPNCNLTMSHLRHKLCSIQKYKEAEFLFLSVLKKRGMQRSTYKDAYHGIFCNSKQRILLMVIDHFNRMFTMYQA